MTELARPSRPLGAALLADGDAEGVGGGDEALHGRGPGIIVRKEVAVGHLRGPVDGAGDLEDVFHARVEGSEIRVADGPVFAEAVVRLRFELVVAEPERLTGPEERSATKEPDANPVVGLGGVEGVGGLPVHRPKRWC